MSKTIKLNQSQKDFLLNTIFSDKREMYKIFDTIAVKYLMKQKIAIKITQDYGGWFPLLMNGEQLTMLNFDYYGKEWNKIWALK